MQKKLETREKKKVISQPKYSLALEPGFQKQSSINLVDAHRSGKFQLPVSLHCCDGGAEGLELAGVVQCSVWRLPFSIFRILFVVC